VLIKFNTLILFCFLSAEVFAAPPNSHAAEKSQQALLATPEVQQYRKNGTTNIHDSTGINDNHVTLALVAYSAGRQELTTKYWKGLRYRDGNFSAQPVLEYNNRERDSRALFQFAWSW
jgi:hypothetical protein